MSFQEIKTLIEKSKHRLNWDDYFMSIAYLISSRSPDKRLRVGSVIVKDNRIISAGYNGFLPNLPHVSIIDSNDHEQATVHSEQNAISDSARRGVSCQDAMCYITHYPCLGCFKTLASSGIKKIIYDENYKNNPIVNELAVLANIEIIKLNYNC
jgi:dCMP deaminase